MGVETVEVQRAGLVDDARALVLLCLPDAERGAPSGSAKTAIRPASITSNGSVTTRPPERRTFEAASSALSTHTYEFHSAVGGPLFGTAPRINGSVKGPRITQAAVKFKAKREKLPGQFDIGEVVRGTFVGTVVDIQFPAKKNSDGIARRTRVHVGGRPPDWRNSTPVWERGIKTPCRPRFIIGVDARAGMRSAAEA